MNTFETRQQEFVDDMAQFDLWNEKFDYLIDLSEDLPSMPSHLKAPDTLLMGCQSRTYFCAMNVSGVLRVHGWSNSLVMQGLLSAIHTMFDGVATTDITSTNVTFHTSTSLINKMTPQRVGGLLQIIERIKSVCIG